MLLDAIIKNCYMPEGKALKDNWFFLEDDIIHMFHMQREEGIPDDRRQLYPASIGHAVSKDLIHWQDKGTVLQPSEAGSIDAYSLQDFTLATGCTVWNEHIKKYQMFYTQRPFDSPSEQYIGTSISDNLDVWSKYVHNPIVSADLEQYDMGPDRDQLGIVHAFRDPSVIDDFDGHGKMHKYMIFTGRNLEQRLCMAAHGNEENSVYNGCVGIAQRSPADKGLMVKWKLLPPILSPACYVEMEVPQIVKKGDLRYLFFSTWKKGNRYATQPGGLYCYMSEDGLQGMYNPVNRNGLVMDYDELRFVYNIEPYGVKLIDTGEERKDYPALGWLNQKRDGEEIKRVSPPFTIHIDGMKVSFIDRYTPVR